MARPLLGVFRPRPAATELHGGAAGDGASSLLTTRRTIVPPLATTTPPPFPDGRPTRFRSTVHGTVFGGRERHFEALDEGDTVWLVPDPPVQEEPGVWVHLESGEPIGHLPAEIAHWLWPWMSGGGVAEAHVIRVEGSDAPSWRRLLIDVTCRVD